MMAFSSTITQRPITMGTRRISMGSWDGGGDNGGDIDTGLWRCEMIVLTPSATPPAAAPAHVETFPCDGSAVTISCGADVDGNWMAFGY